MSPSIREKILDLEADVELLRLAPAAAVRRRGQRRGRRRIALTAASLVLLSAAAGLVTTMTPDRGPASTAAGPAPDGERCGPVDLRLPGSPATVPVRVFDGTGRGGLDESVASSLRERQFTRALSAGAATETVGDEVAVLRYGPRAVGHAGLLRAYFPAPVVLRFDPVRGDDAVDLVVGPRFQRLATATEINQALVAAGPVTMPRECRTG
jgi:hypothetical protein